MNETFWETLSVPYRSIWLLWYVTILHTVWGFLLLYSPIPQDTTPLHSICAISGGRYQASALLIGGALVAGFDLATKKTTIGKTIRCFFVQQFLLFVTAGGAIVATLNSSYADLEIRPRLFIFADQFPSILLALLHIVGVFYYHRRA